MNCERAREVIHDLIDGTLGPIRVAELNQHLDQCPDCRALADDLRRLRDVTATLEPLTPPAHVWMQIAGRLRQEGRLQEEPAREPLHRVQYAWLAIAAALLLAVGGSLYVLFPFAGQNAPQGSVAQQGNAGNADTVQSGVEDLRQAEQLLQSGIDKMRKGLGSDQQGLPPEALNTLDRNLEILDQAIAESNNALRRDPQNLAARNSLFDALQRKISVLQDTISLMRELQKGSASGGAMASEGVNKS